MAGTAEISGETVNTTLDITALNQPVKDHGAAGRPDHRSAGPLITLPSYGVHEFVEHVVECAQRDRKMTFPFFEMHRSAGEL